MDVHSLTQQSLALQNAGFVNLRLTSDAEVPKGVLACSPAATALYACIYSTHLKFYSMCTYILLFSHL